jgi:tRNA (guanine37-N1)-methyltransferase
VKRFDVVTIFPEMFDALADHGITRRALDEGRFELKTWDPRDFTQDNYRRVDDRPYGGGPGMVMLPGPLQACIEAAKARQQEAGVSSPHVVLMSPQGERLGEGLVNELASKEGLVVIAGRYEGVDERLVERVVDREVSIGDYVTSGGELPAMVMIDCIVRRLPGSLNDAESAAQDSFAVRSASLPRGLLDTPHYTRPEEWKGMKVPEVLLSGNHAAIARWRRKQALGRTWRRRPDLLDEKALSKEDRQLLEEYRRELQAGQQQQQ